MAHASNPHVAGIVRTEQNWIGGNLRRWERPHGPCTFHVILRRRGIATDYVPPVSVILASDRDHYIQGLTGFRNGDVIAWLETFATAAARGALLAADYLVAVAELMDHWRELLQEGPAPRRHAAAWALIDVLPAHPVMTAPVAAAATGRAKAAIYQAIDHLATAGVLEPLSASKRNRSWEAVGLLEVLEGLEAGRAATG